MLQAGTDALGLYAANKGRRQFARQIEILAKIPKVSSAKRVPLEIDPGPEHQTVPLIPGFLPNGRADGFQQLRVPACGGGHLRREAGCLARGMNAQHIPRLLLFAQAIGTVAEKERGNPVALHRLGLPKIGAGTEGNLFLQGHLAQNLLNIHLKPHKKSGFPPPTKRRFCQEASALPCNWRGWLYRIARRHPSSASRFPPFHTRSSSWPWHR